MEAQSQTKVEFIDEVVKYISHSQRIFETSSKPYYTNQALIESLRICVNLKRLLLNGRQLPLRNICQMIYLVKKDLWNILPIQSNVSYKNSKMKITNILFDAKEYLRADVQQAVKEVVLS